MMMNYTSWTYGYATPNEALEAVQEMIPACVEMSDITINFEVMDDEGCFHARAWW